MAKILPDKDIKTLIGSVLIGAEERQLNPNGIELRLGQHVLFHSTGEEKELQPGMFLQVSPGESVTISSIESIDFTAETVKTVLPEKMLMGLITPTTTMMREGISQVATKVDAGFRGVLNWSLRNNSINKLVVQHGEPIFKLTVFSLDKDESPEFSYGQRESDSYQDGQGIVRSKRKLPADIPKNKVISSSVEKLDPKKQLREAGYPFDHIGTELTELDGKFQTVSSDVRMMKNEFERKTGELSQKIESETSTLTSKIDETRKNVLEKVEALFDRKFLRVGGAIVGAIPILYGAATFLKGANVADNMIGLIAIAVGIVISVVAFLLSHR